MLNERGNAGVRMDRNDLNEGAKVPRKGDGYKVTSHTLRRVLSAGTTQPRSLSTF